MSRTRFGISVRSIAALAVTIAGMIVSPVLGTEILRNSTVLISDNFNTTAFGGNDALGAQPLADVGAWISDEASVNVNVTNAGLQGVQEGDACLRILNDGSANSGSHFKATFAPVTVVGDTITWRSRVYFTSGGHDDDYQFSIRTTGSGGFPDDYIVLTTIRAGVVNAYNGSAYVPTSTTIVMDQWTTWEISYTRGASTFSWLVNGVGDTAAPALTGAPGRDIGFAMIWGNGTSAGFPVYLDAPSTTSVPVNDTCANAFVVGSGLYGGSTAPATADGTASCGSSNGTPDVWYKVTAPHTGQLRLSTCGSGFDTVLSVYTGCGGTEIACNDNCSGAGAPCTGPASCLSVAVTAAQTYLIRISGVGGATGAYALNVALPTGVVNDSCLDATTITDGTYTGSSAGAIQDGSSSCGSASSPDVWYAYTAATSGNLTVDMCGTEYDGSLSIHSACPGDAGNQLVGACSDDEPGCPFGPLPNSEPKVTVAVTAGQTVYLRLFAWAGATGNYQLNVKLVEVQPPPANDACSSATPIGNGAFTGSTTWATNDGDATCGNSATAVDAWYTYTATCNGVLSADTCGSAYNTVLSVHSDCPGTAGNTLACNDDCAGPASSCLQVPVSSGQIYLIRVSGNGAAKGDFNLHTSCGPAPTIPSLPLTQTFETDAIGSTAGWETAPSLVISPPAVCSDPPPLQVIATDPSPASGGTRSLHWFEPSGGARSGVGRRWNPPASSTTAIMKLSYDFKIVQHTSHGLILVASGFNPNGVLSLNVYSVRFDSTTDDLPLGWNYLDNGAWNNFIPVTDVNQVIGHWFHYSAIINVGTHMVDLTITPLDAGGAGGHIVGTFQGGNPLDADVANYTGLFVFQSNATASSEVLFDNVRIEIAGEEACNEPWADADGDTDVDMDDFGVFQACFTGTTTGLLPGCRCFDRNGNTAVDLNDFGLFKICASGAKIPANPLCAP